MLPVFLLLCLGRTGGQNVVFRAMPDVNFQNVPQGVNVPVIPTFIDGNVRPAVLQSLDANVGPAIMPNFNANERLAMMPNMDANVRPAMMPNMDANVRPAMMPNMDANVRPAMMPNMDANVRSAMMPNMDANVRPAMMPNMDANVRPAMMPNMDANVRPAMMPNMDANVRPAMMPNSDGNVGPAIMRNIDANANMRPGVMPNVDFNARSSMMPNTDFIDRSPVMPNVNFNVRPAVMPNVDFTARSAAVQNLQRQILLRNAASANQQNPATQQRGLARILPFPPVIPQIPEPPSVSVRNPSSQTNNLAFNEFGQQMPNQVQVQQNSNSASGGGAVANLPQSGMVPTNVGNGFRSMQTVNNVNQGQGTISSLTNNPNVNRGGPLDTPAVMPAIPAFNSVEGRFAAGLDFNDPRIRTPSAAAAAAAANFDGPGANTNGLGQNTTPQNMGIDGLAAGPNFGFDQNFAIDTGFQGGPNFERGVDFPGNGFQFNQPEPFPFNVQQDGFIDNGFPIFNPRPQFPEFNSFPQPLNFPGPIGGFPQGDGFSPSPFDGNVFPGLSFPDQIGNTFIPPVGNGFNIIGEPFNFIGNNGIFPGGQVFTM